MKNILLLLALITCTTALAGLSLDTPEVTPQISVTSYMITYFEVDVESSAIIVKYDKLSGTTVISSEIMSLMDAEYLSVLTLKPDGSKTMFENIAEILYTKLQAKTGNAGHIE